MTDRAKCEQAVRAAAREERAARAALQQGIKPMHPSWCANEEEAYQARLGRWQAASHTLVGALNRLRMRRTLTGHTPAR